MLKLLPALFLVLLSSTTWAKTSGNITALCKQQWPGDKGQQSYCIKEKRNYQEWLRYNRKRASANVDARNRIDDCMTKYSPDFKEAYDCVFDRGFF